MFNRVTIIGLGLIGGSLGLAIKDKKIAGEIIGVSRRPSTLKKAISLGAVDSVSRDLKVAVQGSDLVILAGPVLNIVDSAGKIKNALKKGAIVIDVGSTKQHVVEQIEKIIPKGVFFVGSHPMAGSEKSGIFYAAKGLFKGAVCFLAKTNNTDRDAFSKVRKFWEALGMDVVDVSPQAHDKIVSGVSHLPHVLAACLVNSVSMGGLRFAAGGFKDTTRIASGAPEIWKDILLTNRKNIMQDIKVFMKELKKIETALKNNSSGELNKLLNRAKTIRDTLP